MPRADRVLKAIAASYEKNGDPGMPPKCREVFLSLEIFAGNTDMNHDTMRRLKETVEYLRQFISEDGTTLDRLI